jgi:plastocyanin
MVWVAGAVAFLFGAALLGVGLVMAVSMDDDVTHGGSSAAPQTPLINTDSTASVAIRGFDYSPRDLVITVGTSVTWTNYDNAPHNSTDRARTWDTGVLLQGEHKTLRFDEPGTYEYFCIYHYDMDAARLTVR